jgi:hypothetical protein
MSRWRRSKTPREPRDARIEHADGTVTPCGLILDPEVYDDGITRWIAQPAPGTIFNTATDQLAIGELPGRTAVTFSVDVVLGCHDSDRDGCGC